MDAADLKVFQAVARHGSMNRAAEALHTVQSNVTARIRHLEQRLQVRLFDRHNRGVTLTDAGRRLLPYAARVDQLLREARQAVGDDGTPRGPLVIGSLETTAALRLAPVLSDFAAAHPGVDLALRTGTTDELIGQVLGGTLEGAFVCGPVDHPDLKSETAFTEELVILTAPGMADLETAIRRHGARMVVLRAGCSYRLKLEALIARRGVVDVRRLEFGTLEAIVSCVGAGLGFTLLPRALIGDVWQADRVTAHPLPPGDALVETAFIRRRDARTSSALAAFLDCARPTLKTLQAAE